MAGNRLLRSGREGSRRHTGADGEQAGGRAGRLAAERRGVRETALTVGGRAGSLRGGQTTAELWVGWQTAPERWGVGGDGGRDPGGLVVGGTQRRRGEPDGMMGADGLAGSRRVGAEPGGRTVGDRVDGTDDRRKGRESRSGREDGGRAAGGLADRDQAVGGPGDGGRDPGG